MGGQKNKVRRLKKQDAGGQKNKVGGQGNKGSRKQGGGAKKTR